MVKNVGASVVIPTRDREELLQPCVESALRQDWVPIEIIVVDDNHQNHRPTWWPSTLESADENKRLIYLNRFQHEPDRAGPQVCRNIGARSSSYDFVTFLDDDDLLAPHSIRSRMEVVTGDDTIDFCVGRARMFVGSPTANDQFIDFRRARQDDLGDFLLGLLPWQTSCPLWRKSSFLTFGAWNESVLSGQDIELHIRTLAHRPIYKKVVETAYYYRCSRRHDTITSPESKRRSHMRGDRTFAMAEAFRAVGARRAWREELRRAAIHTAIELAFECRLAGGSFANAMLAIEALHHQNIISKFEYTEIDLALKSWLFIGKRCPSRSYLLRRYPALKLPSSSRIPALLSPQEYARVK